MPLMRSGTHVTRTAGVPTLDDIAYGLRQMPRFAGQTSRPWSVLDHSMFCAGMVSGRSVTADRERLALLLHDAHECLTGDIPTDMKTDDMRELQAALDERIMNAYFPGGYRAFATCWSVVKVMDARALAAEAQVLRVGSSFERALIFQWPLPFDTERLRDAMASNVSPETFIERVQTFRECIGVDTSVDGMYCRP